jgi:wyosine [tRNA(Phe)-imidazoG37] synthetase (radical SAM superfamily)
VEAAPDNAEHNIMNATKVKNDPKSAIYGPVYSWRFGNSLGVDLLLHNSICSFRCPYCQLGKIGRTTTERALYVKTDKVIADLKAHGWEDADVITFSGNGEPTLALNLGEAIKAVQKLTKKPVVVLTNGALLSDPKVRKALMTAEHVSCKLDAPTDDLLFALNRPTGELTLEGLVSGIETFSAEFKGELSVQTMLMPGNATHVDDFASLLARVAPSELHVNLPSRPFPDSWEPQFRGDHPTFGSARAFRLLSRDEVTAFGEKIEAKTGLSVRTPE